MSKYKPLLLIIMDGWGLSPSWGGNALAVNTPHNINRLWRDYPHKVLQAFTLVAGKYGVVGDSRLGHSTIAAGRRIEQDLEIISETIADNTFYHNKVLIGAFEHAKKYRSKVHLIGLLSNGGIHAHVDHLAALLELAARQNFADVYLDLITDGIDTGDHDALNFTAKIREKMAETRLGYFSTVIGRMLAMDRVGDRKKTELALKLWLYGSGRPYETIEKAIAESYRQNYTDFTLPPIILKNNGQMATLTNNDAVIFFNFRSDRMLQVLGGLLQYNLKNLYLATMTEYSKRTPAKVAFPRPYVLGTFGEILASDHLRQLRVAEAEKAAHVSSFFNCGNTTPLAGEERQILPSRRSNNPAENPEMQTPKITKTVLRALKSKAYDFILVNLANVDMVSHTGNFQAAGQAIETVDKAVQEMVSANLAQGGATIITADHGNIEEMIKLNPEQDPETKHTLNPVPFICITPENKKNLMQSALNQPFSALSKIMTAKDTLADVAPTMLELMELPKSAEMTGHSLLSSLE